MRNIYLPKPHAFAKSALIMACLIFSLTAQATHIRAGNIFTKSDTTAAKNPFRYFFKLVTYSVVGGIEDEQSTLYFGDCSAPQTAARTARVMLQNGENNTWTNTYYFEHTYASEGAFTVSFVGENRNAGIVNLSNSVQQTFLLTTTITIDQFLGLNRSPILQVPPIDVAAINSIFVHNPGAYDPDGDSLVFRMTEPRISGNNNACGEPTSVVAPEYLGLENFLGTPAENTTASFGLNATTGQLTWNSPNRWGEYNIAFVVEEWRNRRLIGRVVRDMQILVKDIPNKPPRLLIPQDLCLVAGTPLQQIIKATDAEGQRVDISSYPGGISGSTLIRSTNEQNAYTFTWPTECLAVRRQPYQVVFRAVDVSQAGVQPLADVQAWRITVVGPAPVISSVVRQTNNSIQVNWQNYACANARNIHIYRKEGPSTFSPAGCETGIPASSGFIKVGEVTANVTSFLDSNNGQGLPADKTYYYRIYADFDEPAGGKSLASTEIGSTITGLTDELPLQITFYPNPTKDFFQVRTTAFIKIYEAEVFTVQGQRIQSLTAQKSGEGYSYSVKGLAQGMYIIKLQTSQGQWVQRLVVER
ncbi:T9SS type A sorting domain-containing protein [Rufibacter sp. DG15C]|uniref:T9SS type A sorting domain-containing protein n=1 Tax=Rufibacter sp. DG15C TaxID=1379909 RepID=UPI000834BDD2|nr:T9SS type A sorting domain-containing protein [Rufibacter sp. DG15C]